MLSLTRDEFLIRFAERNKLFVTALLQLVGEDEIAKDNSKIFVIYKGKQTEIVEYIGELVRESILRAVDLVYLDL